MKSATEMEALRDASRPVVLAVGFLDGVHRGHRRVIETARKQAAAFKSSYPRSMFIPAVGAALDAVGPDEPLSP